MYKMICIPVAFAVTGFAQTPAAPKDFTNPKAVTVQLGEAPEFGPLGITAALAGPMSTIAGAPYSAQTATQRIQVLADGNRIEQTTTGSVARDSQGRIRRGGTFSWVSSHHHNTPPLFG